MRYVVFAFACIFLCSCVSTGKYGDSNIVAGNSRAVGRLEATIEALDRTVADSRERVAAVIATSRDVENGIDRLEYLFRCYEREVVGLQREIDRIRGKASESEGLDIERNSPDSFGGVDKTGGSDIKVQRNKAGGLD